MQTKQTKLTPQVVAALADAELDGLVVRLTQQLDRKLYLACNEALQALGGTWNRKLKGHLFPDDPANRLAHILLTRTVEVPKSNGYFPTPPDTARLVVEAAELVAGHVILEPSAGQGALIDAALRRCPSCHVFGFELLEANAKILKEKYASDPRVRTWQDDFLGLTPMPQFDRVIMNPPFEDRADLAHVLRAFEWLVPKGRLVAIMSAGVTFREDSKSTQFREFVIRHRGTIHKLPDGAFKQSGTSVSTVIINVTA